MWSRRSKAPNKRHIKKTKSGGFLMCGELISAAGAAALAAAVCAVKAYMRRVGFGRGTSGKEETK